MNEDNDCIWPTRGKQLFVEGGNPDEFSHIGWGDMLTQFNGYASGYKFAADQLIEKFTPTVQHNILDTILFPICFLYRQYLELTMKSILLQYSEITASEIKEIFKNINHNLPQMWNNIKPILSNSELKLDGKDILIVEEYINQFHRMDKSSYNFRYPVTKELATNFTSEKRINLPNLRIRMDELESFFIGCMGMLDQISGLKNTQTEEFLLHLD